jgi:hypothetical protein
MISAIACLFIIGMIPEVANAGFLVHATRKAFVPKIMKGGFKMGRMNPKARFGKQIYLSDKAKTALKERPHAGALMSFRKSRMFNKRTLDTTHMSTNKLRSVSRFRDMRGTVKKGVLGPKIGHRIGRYANKNGLIVKYNSARYKRGTNYAIPQKIFKMHPRIVRPVRSWNVK